MKPIKGACVTQQPLQWPLTSHHLRMCVTLLSGGRPGPPPPADAAPCWGWCWWCRPHAPSCAPSDALCWWTQSRRCSSRTAACSTPWGAPCAEGPGTGPGSSLGRDTGWSLGEVWEVRQGCQKAERLLLLMCVLGKGPPGCWPSPLKAGPLLDTRPHTQGQQAASEMLWGEHKSASGRNPQQVAGFHKNLTFP